MKWGGDWDLIFRVAVWGVIAGIVGARIYHLITSWNQDSAIHAHWYGPFAVWSGGLGIWGAIPFGLLVGAWVVHRSGNSVRLMMDAVAPGLLLAQGIGRWGNYFNQELYGKHTTLPWALEIHGKTAAHLYHPTFLYEFIWDILGVLALLWIDRRFTIKRPGLFALYVAIYTAFRTYEETLRIDPSNHFARAADQLLGLARRVHRLGLVLRLVAVPPEDVDGRAVVAAEADTDGAEDGRAEGPRPVVRIRSPV